VNTIACDRHCPAGLRRRSRAVNHVLQQRQFLCSQSARTKDRRRQSRLSSGESSTEQGISFHSSIFDLELLKNKRRWRDARYPIDILLVVACPDIARSKIPACFHGCDPALEVQIPL
jgi:hypothetical protein